MDWQKYQQWPCFLGGRLLPHLLDAMVTFVQRINLGQKISWLCRPGIQVNFAIFSCYEAIWAMVNTHYMVDGHPIHNKDPYNGYYKSLWTIGWLAPINGY